MWAEHCRRHGGELVVVPFEPDGVTIDPQRVADAIDDHTLVVSVSLVQFRTSALLDLPPVQDAARQHGAVLLLDAYQAVGCSAGRRCGKRRRRLCRWVGEVPVRRARQRLALRSVRTLPRRCDRARSAGSRTRARSTSNGRRSLYAPGIQRFAGGTPNVPAAYAASPGYEAIVDVGMERIRERSQ